MEKLRVYFVVEVTKRVGVRHSFIAEEQFIRLVVVTRLITIKLKYNLRLLLYDLSRTKQEGYELEVKGLFLIGNYTPPNDHDFRTVLPSV